MEQGKRRQTLEIIGALGVIASLVFVGLEVRESSRATRAATDAEIAAQFVEINVAMYGSELLGADWHAASEAGHPSLAPPESRFRLTAHARALFHVWSNAHRQHLNGAANPLLFEAVAREVTAYTAPESPDASLRIDETRRWMQWAWESQAFLYNSAFQAFVDSTMAAQR